MKFRDIWGKFETNLGKVGWQPCLGNLPRKINRHANSHAFGVFLTRGVAGSSLMVGPTTSY